jgi:hypothetical protein
MDNRVFNVNGRGEEALAATINLAILHEGWGDKRNTLEGWRVSEEKGLILYRYIPSDREAAANRFLAPMTPAQVAPVVMQWLKQQHEAKTTYAVQTHWDEDIEHDGSNSEGWRCYVEDWGHVEDDWGVCVAVVPAHMWHGK